jgi:hypothetical protein
VFSAENAGTDYGFFEDGNICEKNSPTFSETRSQVVVELKRSITD